MLLTAKVGLGDADSPVIRNALVRCLEDSDENVREEAAVGLGKRHDERLIPKLRLMLDAPDLSPRVQEAAALVLALPEVPSDWTSVDYRNALNASLDREN